MRDIRGMALTGDDSSLVERVAELADRIAAGEKVDLDELARHDEAQVRELQRMLPAIAMMAELGVSSFPAKQLSPGAGGGEWELWLRAASWGISRSHER